MIANISAQHDPRRDTCTNYQNFGISIGVFFFHS